MGEVEADERARLADHLAGCSDCSELLQDLRSLEGWAERVAEAHAPARSRSATPSRVRWLVAASIAVLAVAAVVWNVSRPGATGVGTGEDIVRGAPADVSPPNATELTAPPELFRWRAELGASGYRVTLYRSSGEEVWKSDWLTEPTATAPGPDAALWEDGGYLWVVSIRGNAARTKQGPFDFRLEGRDAPLTGSGE